jgi:CubicO group peptidase (beta-lactamase class C family)
MRRPLPRWSLLAALLCLACAAGLHAQPASPSLAGDYAGTLGSLHLRLHIQQRENGALIGTMDSVDQGAFGIPCADLAIDGAQFSFSIPAVHGTYKGEILAGGLTISGIWNQGSPQPLIFKRRIQATAEDVSAELAQIDSLAAAAFARNPIGSVTVGVVSGNQLIWTKSYGNADMEKHLAAGKDTVYRIGSITKMFTAVMLEQLADAGTVHLSDPVEKYFPEINSVQGRFTNAPPITLIQLATHTSGLAREPNDTEKYVEGGPVSDWEKFLIAALPHLHYAAEPGTRFIYSNIGYASLGAALSRAAGQPYLQYVPAHIFAPLGMDHSALDVNPGLLAHLSKGYTVEPGGKIDADAAQRELAGRGYKVPNGAIFTTVGDLGKFASFLMGFGPDTVLKTTSLEKYLNQIEVPSNSQLSQGYGLGFMVLRRDGYIAFGHGGDVAGYQAALYMNRDKGIALVVMANALGPGTVDTEDIALQSLDLLSK